MIGLVPHWPRERLLELSPKHWLRTPSRRVTTELVRELGPLEVPPPAEEQAPAG